MASWLPSGFQFNFKIPIGTVALKPAIYTLNFQHQDGKMETISVDDRYVYQSGNHCVQMQPDGKGGYIGNISQLALGVFSNIVVEFPNQPGKALIAGKFDNVQALYAVSYFQNPEKARENLRNRGDTPNIGNIGFTDFINNNNHVRQSNKFIISILRQWNRHKHFDAILKSDFSSRFTDRTNQSFTIEMHYPL